MMCHTRRNRPFDVIRRHEISATYTKYLVSALRIPEGHFEVGVALFRTDGVRCERSGPSARRCRRARASARRTLGISGLGFSGITNGGARGRTVNRRTERDRGWTVELPFPWRGLTGLADGRSLPPKDGDVWRIDSSRFEKIGKDREVLDPCVGWTWNRRRHYDSHIPEVFPYVTFSRKSVAG
jgi:hypothetical protein